MIADLLRKGRWTSVRPRQGTTLRSVFARWLADRPSLDRIDFVDVVPWPGQFGAFGSEGPVVTITRNP
jgi:hypothetical protein